MITIFGSHGYMGSALAVECSARGIQWQPGNRAHTGEMIHQIKHSVLVINAAAFIPSPSVDACSRFKNETVSGNVILPTYIKHICYEYGIPLIHLSTGCLFDEQREYSEKDTPTRGWDGHCGFYVGTKLMAESIVREWQRHYILRLRLPFDEVDHPRNYLSKLMAFDRVYDHVNSLTHRGDFAKWALSLWQNDAPYGTYHCCNRGRIAACDVVTAMSLRGMMPKQPEFVRDSGTTGAKLNVNKLSEVMNADVTVRPVHEAISESLGNWRHV
jgi:dTDP-4-dehydrorhamnose reductase